MDPISNPYTPGAGRKPPAFVGREEELQQWDILLRRLEKERTDRPLVLYGLRGVGKTVLLNAMRKHAAERTWVTVHIEAGNGKGLRENIGDGLHAPMKELIGDSTKNTISRWLRAAVATLTSFKATYDHAGQWSFGLDISPTSGGADSNNLDIDLQKLVEDISTAIHKERGTGLALLIDEGQDLKQDDLQALATLSHKASQEGWVCAIVISGLPTILKKLMDARSYSERLFSFHRISSLDEEAARQALTEPAAEENITWDDDAVDFVREASQCYPYFIQQFGYNTWQETPDDATVITVDDARRGVEAGHRKLDQGFYSARWEKATNAEKAYLRAMAAGGLDECETSVVAQRLGKTTTSLGPNRANLIAKGLVYPPRHGVVAFSVPGMARFIERQPCD